jgi:hypothetical protein
MKDIERDLLFGGLDALQSRFGNMSEVLLEKSFNIWAILVRRLRRSLDPIDMTVDPDDTLINKVSNVSTDSDE